MNKEQKQIKYYLENGVQVILNPMPHMRSAAAGVFIRSGSIYETPDNNGIAHFIEHMLFKGTKNRSLQQIAEESDRLGGNLNAYTCEEYTCIYMKVLEEDVFQAVDLLTDIACNPVFEESALENEKNVVLEEIINAEDNPEDAVQEMLMRNMFRSHPVGQPVLGSAENVLHFCSEKVREFYKKQYCAENVLISIAGKFEPEKIVQAIEASALKYMPRGRRAYLETCADTAGGVFYRFRDVEQMQLAVGYPCVSRYDPRLFSFTVLAQILSGDTSSRLFRRLREENGLVYNVDATAVEYDDTGAFIISTGFSPENYERVTEIIRQEAEDLLHNGASQEEVERSKRNICVSLQLEQEGTSSVMSIAGKRGLFGIDFTTDEAVVKIQNVSRNEIFAAAQFAFGNRDKEAIALVGDGKAVKIRGILNEMADVKILDPK